MKRKEKVIGSLISLLFLISFISIFPINGLTQTPNVELISEAEITTRWDFVNETAGYNTLYYEPFDNASSYWDLYDVSERIINTSHIPTDDAYVSSALPDINYGSLSNIQISYITIPPDQYMRGFIKWEYPYLDLNCTTNSSLYAYLTTAIHPVIHVYNTSNFDESTITWNNQPVSGNYHTSISPSVGWQYLDIGTPEYYYEFIDNDTLFDQTKFYSSEKSGYEPRIIHHLSKNYQGSGILYCQTNETETITLRSPNNLSLTLQEGDKIEVKFNTSSTNRIDFNLRNNSIQQANYILSSQGNGDFSNRIKTFTVSSNMSVDQMEFTGSFIDTKNLIVDYVRIIRSYSDVISYYVEPYGRKELDIGYPHNYTVEIYENDVQMEIKYITTSATLQTLIYKRIDSEIIYLTYYDSNNEHLDFNDYITYTNYTLDNSTNTNKRLSSNILYVDKDTQIYFKIYDSFNALVKTTSQYEETFIDIILNVYSLKIKNEASEYADYILKNNNSGIEKSGNIFPAEIIEFNIATGDYILNYTNHEDNYPRSLEFEFTTHKIITINTTYHQVYFGLFTYDGLGIDYDLVRFYINNVRKDFGRNIIQSETANLIVLDYFNNTLANDTIDASAYSEYNIYVEIYSLYILNVFIYHDLIFNITQVGSGYYMNQLIPASSALLYRFIPNINYTINATYVNGTVYSSRMINLTENSQTESFGIGEPEEYPKNVYFGVYTATGLGINHDLLKFYIDNVRADFGFNRIENEIVNITVKDYFNTTLLTQLINTSGIYEYNILITLYSLKIKNEARVAANYTLSLGALETTGYILPEEIVEYQLATNNYVFDYTNNEDGSSDTININLNESKVYVLNTTYFDVYFALFTYDGLGMNYDTVRFYINSERKDLGFNTLKQDVNNLKILDYFNATLFNRNVNLRGYTEYNIFVEVYTLIINNNYSHSIRVKIERNNIEIETVIPAQYGMSYRFLPHVEYEITAYFLNGTKIEKRYIKLDSHNKIVSFGFYETEVPDTPEPLEDIVENWIWIVSICAICGLIYISFDYFNTRWQFKKVRFNQNAMVYGLTKGEHRLGDKKSKINKLVRKKLIKKKKSKNKRYSGRY